MFRGTNFSFRRFLRSTWSAGKNVATMDIRVVAFPEGDRWCAQCLEYDIAVQAEDECGLKSAIIDAIKSEIEVSRELGVAPFSRVPRAPEIFFKMYEEADRKILNDHGRGTQNQKNILDSAMRPVIRWATPVPAC